MIDFMKSIAFEAGEICLQALENKSELELEFKGEKDLVTAIDKKVEDFLLDEIGEKYPHHSVLGEERGLTAGDRDCRWIIDPIDGTVSFVHGLPGFSISLAYEENGNTVAGVVYGPMLGQMFTAERGKGAALNGKAITVSKCDSMIDSVWATGFACMREGRPDNNLPILGRILPRVRDIRRMGSAALDLAYVAAGKIEGFWELSLAEYDVAAGVLLVEEAGGEVCDFRGEDRFPEQGILATNRQLTSQLLPLLRQ